MGLTELRPQLIEFLALEPQARPQWVQEHPEIGSLKGVENILSLASELQFGELRHLAPPQEQVDDFLMLARVGYVLAEQLGAHVQCAEAAGMQADAVRRFSHDRVEEGTWWLVQAVHSALSYPSPKFSSTFDIALSTTQDVVEYSGVKGVPMAAAFIRRTAELLRTQIGARAVDELTRFLTIPHDWRTTTLSLLYLVELHRCGLDARASLPVVCLIDPAAQPVNAAALAAVLALEVLQCEQPAQLSHRMWVSIDQKDADISVEAAQEAILRAWFAA